MRGSRTEKINRTGRARHAALPSRRRRFARTRIFWALFAVITLLMTVSVVMKSGVFRGPHAAAPSSLPPAKPPTVSAAPPGTTPPRKAYAASGPPGAARSVNAHSPVTDVDYVMNCVPNGGLITCTGGNKAVVYIY